MTAGSEARARATRMRRMGPLRDGILAGIRDQGSGIGDRGSGNRGIGYSFRSGDLLMIRRVVLTVSALALAASASAQTPAPAQPPRPAMTLTTPAFPDGDPIPAKYTQAGE